MGHHAGGFLGVHLPAAPGTQMGYERRERRVVADKAACAAPVDDIDVAVRFR